MLRWKRVYISLLTLMSAARVGLTGLVQLLSFSQSLEFVMETRILVEMKIENRGEK